MNPSELITNHITGLADWRGQRLARLRTLIAEADPRHTEEWKWSSPVWSYKGLVCSIGAFKEHVGINFFQGATLKDPHGLFNGGLDAKASRSIKLREGNVHTNTIEGFWSLVKCRLPRISQRFQTLQENSGVSA